MSVCESIQIRGGINTYGWLWTGNASPCSGISLRGSLYVTLSLPVTSFILSNKLIVRNNFLAWRHLITLLTYMAIISKTMLWSY